MSLTKLTMSQEKRLEIYDKVNTCETFKELADVIRGLADENGNIRGRSREFDAEKMAMACEMFLEHYTNYPNVLTREFGIRQQAMYIEYYTPSKSLKG